MAVTIYPRRSPRFLPQGKLLPAWGLSALPRPLYWWPLSDRSITVHEISTTRFTGTRNSTGAIANSQFGPCFNGDPAFNYNISLGTGPSVKGLASYTIAATVRIASFPTSGNAFTAYWEPSNAASNVRLKLLAQDNDANYGTVPKTLTARFRDLDANAPINLSVGANTLALGTFYRLAFTFSAAAQRVYINGILRNSAANALSAVSNTTPATPIVIGADDVSVSTEWWSGTIGDVRIWNTALTANQIAWEYTELATMMWQLRNRTLLPAPAVAPVNRGGGGNPSQGKNPFGMPGSGRPRRPRDYKDCPPWYCSK